jgi:exo-beta-1,3-glucanase (GH17 family)
MYKFKSIIAIIFAAVAVSMCTSPVQNNDAVEISGRQLIVDGSPYLIKGICYHPVPKGSGERDFSILPTDLKIMQKAGINTIRIYSPIDDKNVLDQMHEAGMKLIVGYGYNQGGYYDIVSGSFIDYVKKFKDHPVILMWELGNEYNYHPEWFEGDLKNWYRDMNDAAAKIKEVDVLHPVTTAHGDLPDDLALSMSPNIDVWGMNVYRWDKPGDLFDSWKKVSDKPMYLAEAGADSYMAATMNGYEQGPNEKAQADATRNILKEIFDNKDVCSGVTLFAFNDEWWKAGNNDTQDPGGWAPESGGVPYDGAANEEYWGIVDIDRNEKEVFEVVEKFYTNN